MVASLDLDVESLAAQLDGVDTDMHEQLDARIQLEPEGVTGIRSSDDGGVGGTDDRVVTGLDGDTIADDAGGEDRIGDLGDRDRTPLERGGDGDGLGSDIGSRRGLAPLDRGGPGLGAGGTCGGNGSRSSGDSSRLGHRTLSVGSPGLGTTSLGSSLLVVVTVIAHDDQGHGGEEGGRDGDGIQTDVVKGWDCQQGGEDEGRGVQAAAGTDDDATDETAGEHGRVDLLVPQMDAVEAGLGDTTEQTGRQGAGRRLAHRHVLVTDGQEEDAGGGAEAGEVPGTHRALDVVVAQGLDVEQHDGVERPVQAQRNHERVEQRDEDGEDERGDIVDRLEPVGQTSAGVDTDGADEEGRQRDHDEHGQEGHEDHLDIGGDDLLEPLVQRSQDGRHDEGREDLGAVVEDRQRQTEDVDDIDLESAQSQRVSGLAELREPREHHDGHDGESNPRVGIEPLGGVVGDQQWQEVENTLPGQVHELPARRQGDTGVGPVADDSHGTHEGHEGDEQ